MWHKAYDGISTDPKWVCVAAMAAARRSDVVAMWTYLLDCASQAEDRGSIAGLDPRVAAAWLELPAEKVAAILAALTELGLVAQGRIAKWERRQKDLSTPRVRSFRERQREAAEAEREARPAAAAPAATPATERTTAAETPVKRDETVVKRDETPERERENKNLYPSLSESLPREEIKPDHALSRADARAVPVPGAGFDLKQLKRDRWLSRVLMVEARRLLPPSRWQALCEACLDDPMPRWAKAELERIDTLARRDQAARGAPARRRRDIRPLDFPPSAGAVREAA